MKVRIEIEGSNGIMSEPIELVRPLSFWEWRALRVLCSTTKEQKRDSTVRFTLAAVFGLLFAGVVLGLGGGQFTSLPTLLPLWMILFASSADGLDEWGTQRALRRMTKDWSWGVLF